MKRYVLIFFAVIGMCMPSAQAQINSHVASGLSKLYQAATIKDADLVNYIRQYVSSSDSSNVTAAADSPYTLRLAKITEGITEVDGMPLNFKVYVNDEANAFACADGSVRVYTGLLDIMDDDEVLGVIGHEMGHVAHKDTKKAMQQALAHEALKDGLSAMSSTLQRLNESQLGAIGDALSSARYSRKQEEKADDYGYDFLKKNGKNPAAMAFSFHKLKELSGSQQTSKIQQLLSTHPDLDDRIARMEKKARKDGYSLEKKPKVEEKPANTNNTTKKKTTTTKKKTSSTTKKKTTSSKKK